MKRKLLIEEIKSTYMIINGLENKQTIINKGIQIYNGDYTYIYDIDEKSNDTYEEIDEIIFNLIQVIKDYDVGYNALIDIIVEKTCIKKCIDKKNSELVYFTVVYSIDDADSGKNIANEFLVFEEINSSTKNDILQCIYREIDWFKISKKKCSNKIFEQWVLTPTAAGFFFHECIGHLLEEDQFQISNYNLNDVIFNSPISVYENCSCQYELDDYGHEIKHNICLIDKGKIVGVLNTVENGTGNAYTQNPHVQPIARMNDMYVACQTISKELLNNNIKNGIYIEEISCGEYNPINGEIGLTISKSYQICSGKRMDAFEPLTFVFNIKDLMEAEIYLNDIYEKKLSLCGKYGALKLVKYKVPYMRLDWREHGQFFSSRNF